MHARFYVPGSYGPGSLVDLPEDEAQHASRVLRLGVGAPVRVFDGAGHEFEGTVAEVGRARLRVAITDRAEPAAEARVTVALLQAVLKGDKMDDVVRDAVMLGVAAIQPVVTERSEVSLVTLERGARRERWHRVAVASAKQCGRAVVPAIAAPAMLGPVLRAAAPGLTVMCVEPGLPAGGQPITSLPAVPPGSVSLLVGPEGGWAPGEVARGAEAASLVTLGNRTLRADAVAIVALTALYTHWREL